MSEPTPEAIAADLPTKLRKRLLLCAHHDVPWNEAPKSHRQLRTLGLVHEASLDGEIVALGTPYGRAVAKVLARNPERTR